MGDITEILAAARLGEKKTAESLLPLVYDELRRLAKVRMMDEQSGHTLDPTALVHEAWLRMVGESDRTWHNRSYFFTVASTAMRRILVDHARKRAAAKRGSDWQRVDLEKVDLADAMPDEKTLRVESALEQMERVHPEWSQVTVMKYFGGMTNREVAVALGVTERTIERKWACAKSWMYNHMAAPS